MASTMSSLGAIRLRCAAQRGLNVTNLSALDSEKAKRREVAIASAVDGLVIGNKPAAPQQSANISSTIFVSLLNVFLY